MEITTIGELLHWSYAMRKALVCLLLALACTAHAETATSRVVGVADGDTITVLDAEQDEALH